MVSPLMIDKSGRTLTLKTKTSWMRSKEERFPQSCGKKFRVRKCNWTWRIIVTNVTSLPRPKLPLSLAKVTCSEGEYELCYLNSNIFYNFYVINTFLILLFSPSPATVGTTSTIAPEDQSANESRAREELNVDTSQPLTTIQIRFADGSNTRAQFNLTHTIADIRQFITTYPFFTANVFL